VTPGDGVVVVGDQKSVLWGTGTVPVYVVVPPEVDEALGVDPTTGWLLGVGDGCAVAGPDTAVPEVVGEEDDGATSVAMASGSVIAVAVFVGPASAVTTPALGDAGVAAWERPL
jgi:hypothetical protein